MWTITSTIQLYGSEDVVVGLLSTVSRNEQTLIDHPTVDGWKNFVFTHAPPNGSGLCVLQENPCCQWMLLVES